MKAARIMAWVVSGAHCAGIAHAAEFCEEINALITDGHQAFQAVSAGSLKVSGASLCEATPPERYALGDLRCEWRYSRFAEPVKLDQSATEMVKGMYDCLKPTFEKSEMPDRYRFRGVSRSTKQLVDVLVSSSPPGIQERTIVLYVNILKPDM
jgi:hypothetical protein